ncbi:hypothetical protein [Silvanigrella aquatica]|uniref:Uncharacterized protein n=1 Tax=Silvanigrella aquatica TaxID=1915309 RepID=A0A1L4CX51_9BACT|nr:hypothetical protein [Silvanigrella aquatica]APJ02524.1 hypothetical protein AXG55_00670 [Silvanigrella aquatica]
MTNVAHIAANHILSRLPHTQLMPFERLAYLFRDNLLISRKKMCYCGDNHDQIKKFPMIYPVFPSEGEASKGLYSSIPFVYLSWMIPSHLLPRIEVIEVPIPFENLQFSEVDKDEIDKQLIPQGKTIIGVFKKVSLPLSTSEMAEMRKRVLSQILELSGKNAHIYLSIFSEMPKILVGHGISSYQDVFEIPQNRESWEFQSKRVMPIVFQKKLVVFTLNCWILTKKDLNI